MTVCILYFFVAETKAKLEISFTIDFVMEKIPKMKTLEILIEKNFIEKTYLSNDV